MPAQYKIYKSKTMKLNIKNTALGLLAVASLSFTSCKKDNPKPQTSTADPAGTVEVNLEHKWGTGNANFSLNMDLIHPITQDTLHFTTMKYYISNLQLKKADGTWWKHPESYFFVDMSNATSSMLKLTGVPVGQYTEMNYTFGVDSTRNVSGAQAGALSIANNMFWNWNSGYIMLKAEGTSVNSTTGSFAFHLGGFSGTNNVVATRNAEFTNISLNITKDHKSEIHMIVYPDKLWATAGSVSGTNTIHMPGAGAKVMANDFVGGFAFDHIHN